MQDCIERLPRPISRMTSKHYHQQRKVHATREEKVHEDDGNACPKEEDLLLIGLQVFEQAFR